MESIGENANVLLQLGMQCRTVIIEYCDNQLM